MTWRHGDGVGLSRVVTSLQTVGDKTSKNVHFRSDTQTKEKPEIVKHHCNNGAGYYLGCGWTDLVTTILSNQTVV